MEESMNKIIWVVVAVALIGGIYVVLKMFFPELLKLITGKLTQFVKDTFDSMTGSDKDKDNNKDNNLAPETGAGAGGGSSK